MDAAEKLAKIEELRVDNRSKLEELTRAGVGEIPLGMARLEMVIEAVLPWQDGTNEARLDMELRWEEHANAVLARIVEQATRARLLHGVNLNTTVPNGHRP